jgi:hypothetical protein
MNRIESVTKPLKWSMALLLAALVAGCGDDPILGTGGAPGAGVAPINLGILAPFGIASAGGITNVNSTITTKVNGDVVMAPNQFCNGVVVGSTNDFGPCNVTGGAPTNNSGDLVITQIWNGTSADTTTADAVMVELLAQWNSTSPAGMPLGTVLGCGTIGDGGDAGALIGCNGNATLPPGVYISSTGSTIGVAGTLTLNGGPTSVWVFQAPSAALTTAPNSTILLTGGAKASNVFWHVGSSATLNGGTTFQGNILASASITMGALATSCGRLLSGAEASGAFVFESNVVSVPGHANAPVGCE